MDSKKLSFLNPPIFNFGTIDLVNRIPDLLSVRNNSIPNNFSEYGVFISLLKGLNVRTSIHI